MLPRDIDDAIEGRDRANGGVEATNVFPVGRGLDAVDGRGAVVRGPRQEAGRLVSVRGDRRAPSPYRLPAGLFGSRRRPSRLPEADFASVSASSPLVPIERAPCRLKPGTLGRRPLCDHVADSAPPRPLAGGIARLEQDLTGGRATRLRTVLRSGVLAGSIPTTRLHGTNFREHKCSRSRPSSRGGARANARARTRAWRREGSWGAATVWVARHARLVADCRRARLNWLTAQPRWPLRPWQH